MTPYEEQERLEARIREWFGLAFAKGGETLVGCPSCGRSFDLRDLVRLNMDDHIARDGLPCGCGTFPMPFSALRKRETYGL